MENLSVMDDDSLAKKNYRAMSCQHPMTINIIYVAETRANILRDPLSEKSNRMLIRTQGP